MPDKAIFEYSRYNGPMTPNLYIVRHAESAMNVQPHLVGGRSNEAELTERGVAQARALGRLLLEQVGVPKAVYASPAVRTQATARHALEAAGLQTAIRLDEALYEMDQGDYVGRERNEVYTDEVLEMIARQGKDFKLPGGESMNDVGERMLDWADTHEAEAADGPLVVFGHGLAIRCLASTIHGWSHRQTFITVVPNASLTHFSKENGTWQLKYMGLLPTRDQ